MSLFALGTLLLLAIPPSHAGGRDPRRHNIRPRSINTGTCGSAEIQYGKGLDGQPDFTYKPVNNQDFQHGASKEIDQIVDFICQRLQSLCNAPADSVSQCQQLASQVSGQSDGTAADNWNAGFGISTNFGGGNPPSSTSSPKQSPTSTPAQAAEDNLPSSTTSKSSTSTPQQNPPTSSPSPSQGQQQQSPSQTAASVTSSAITDTVASQNISGGTTSGVESVVLSLIQTTDAFGQTITTSMTTMVTVPPPAATFISYVNPDEVQHFLQDEGCALQAILVTMTLPVGEAAETGTISKDVYPLQDYAALDLGSCTDPTIAFGQGLGGRSPNDMAFQNNDQVLFPHGSTLDIATTAQYTCNNLVNTCGLSTNSPAVLACNEAEAEAASLGDTGAAADLFNRLMGFSTFYAAVDGS